MTDHRPVRIDKFLWAVRICKTRGQAITVCRMGRVLIDGNNVKPSRIIAGNELMTLKKPPVTYTFRILSPLEHRVSAKLVPSYLADLTPESEKVKILISRNEIAGYRKKGSGRPTKKERRIIDQWQDSFKSK